MLHGIANPVPCAATTNHCVHNSPQSTMMAPLSNPTMIVLTMALVISQARAYTPFQKFSGEYNIRTSELDNFRDEFKVLYSESQYPDADWTLSKVEFRDSGDTSAPHLVIYGNSVWTTDGSGASAFPTCEAWFNDTKCASCLLCGKYVASAEFPWTVLQSIGGDVLFDCEGLVDNRVCVGPTVVLERDDVSDNNYFSPDEHCYYEEGAFVGVKTCFIDAPTPAPTPSPTGSASATIRSSAFLLVLLGLVFW